MYEPIEQSEYLALVRIFNFPARDERDNAIIYSCYHIARCPQNAIHVDYWYVCRRLDLRDRMPH